MKLREIPPIELGHLLNRAYHQGRDALRSLIEEAEATLWDTLRRQGDLRAVARRARSREATLHSRGKGSGRRVGDPYILRRGQRGPRARSARGRQHYIAN